MTARSDDPDVSPETAAAVAGGEIWDTWEELLLASAVKRHGTASWDSVAMEMQSRCSSAAAARFTPSGCRLRFRLLHRRFAAGAENGGGGDDDEDPAAAATDEWVEELRKLRVAELRREVERRDLSIGSLQSKVKRLKEERERSISGEATPAVKEEAEDEGAMLAKGSPQDDDLAGEDRVSGGESGRSCKKSNSSDLKRPGHDAGTASAAGDGDAAAMDKEEAAAGESVSVKREEASGESVAGSMEADAERESSYVQSSASPSRRRAREGGGGEEAGAKAEAEEASPSSSAPAAIPAAEAEALSAFLESVRTSKPGSVFELRLESQGNANYRSTIRRHVDLETIRSRLEVGGTCYSSASEFYRDLLLLCTNALVFFPRGSPEHAAAAQTRVLVTKHMSAPLRKDQPGTSGKAAAAPSAASKKPKANADVGSLLEKTAPIIVCRKRSSIAKAAAAAAKAEKVEKEETEEEEENDVKKKVATKDKTRGLRTNKTRGGVARKAGPNQRAGKDSKSESAAAEGTKKSDKKGGGGAATGGVAKKRNAVDFLNRMKQNSGPSTERVSLLETLKLSAAAEQKKSRKGEARKEFGSGSKRGKDTPAGRRIGRPPKRAAAPPSPPPSKRAKGSGKRGGKK